VDRRFTLPGAKLDDSLSRVVDDHSVFGNAMSAACRPRQLEAEPCPGRRVDEKGERQSDGCMTRSSPLRHGARVRASFFKPLTL
jgi:hypothetical protein